MSERQTFSCRSVDGNIILEAGDWRTYLTQQEARDLYAALRTCGQMDSDAVELGRVEFERDEERKLTANLKDRLVILNEEKRLSCQKIRDIAEIIESSDEYSPLRLLDGR